MRSIMLATLLLGLPLCASAQMYKCTQPDGKVGFQDRPCQGAATGGQIDVRPPALIGAPGEAEQANEEAARKRAFAAERQQLEELEAERKARAESPKRKYRCERARYNLRALQAERPLYTKDSAGNRTYLEDADRDAEMAAVQQAIRQNCD